MAYRLRRKRSARSMRRFVLLISSLVGSRANEVRDSGLGVAGRLGQQAVDGQQAVVGDSVRFAWQSRSPVLPGLTVFAVPFALGADMIGPTGEAPVGHGVAIMYRDDDADAPRHRHLHLSAESLDATVEIANGWSAGVVLSPHQLGSRAELAIRDGSIHGQLLVSSR